MFTLRVAAGKKVSKEELNEIFETGESQIFVQDVSVAK